MKHPEYFGHWYDKIMNSWPFMLDDQSIHTIGFAWVFKENGKWNFIPRITGNEHQYFNAIIFIRIGFPFCLFAGFRFSKTRLFQFGIGWKQSGRFAIHFRLQTDKSAAEGYHEGMPNTNQSQGFEYGGH